MTASSGNIIAPVDTKLVFDGTTNGNLSIFGNTSGQLNLLSNNSIFLTTTSGNIVIPQNTNIQFGSTSQLISGSTSGILVKSLNSGLDVISNSSVNIRTSSGNILLFSNIGDIILNPTSGSVRIGDSRKLILGLSGTGNSISVTNNNILVSGNSTNNIQFSQFSAIDLFSTTSVNLLTNTRLHIGSDNLKSISSNTTNQLLVSNETSNGSIIISSLNTFINNTSGNLYINNSSSNISSSSFIISGTSGSITRIDTENVKFRDPIISLSDFTLSSSDNKDRGLEYNYYNGSLRHGWFGYKDTTQRFTFYLDSINTNEVMSGTLGNIEANTGYFQNGISFTTSGSVLDFNCGSILRLNSISGCSGDITINGTNNITSNASNIFLSATSKVQLPYNIPISFGSTDNSISCSTSGVLTIHSGSLVIDGNVQINGTTSNVYSTVTNIQDPIISLGGVSGPVVDDNKDRGIEFKWNTLGTPKTGFFGFKDSLERFVFIRDGTNTNEVFSGAYSDVQFGNAYLTNISFNSGGNISGLSELSGGQILIKTTSGNINLSPTSGSNIIIPFDTKLSFGDTSNSISSNTLGNMLYTSSNNTTITAIGSINFNTTTSVRYPENVPIYYGPSNDTFIMNSGGNLNVVNSAGNINLTPEFSSGSINIPPYNYLNFANSSNSIYSDGDQLFINGYSGINFDSSSVNFSGNVNIVGTITATNTTFDFNDYILPLGTFQLLPITNIQNSVTSSGNIQITTSIAHNFVVGDIVTINNSDSTPGIDGVYTVTNIVSANIFKIDDPLVTFTVDGSSGTVKSKLTTDQNKDVGIQVNYWTTTGNSSLTSGTLGFKTGFFGFDESIERWSFYSDATISNSVVSGTPGDIQVNKVYTNKISGFDLEGNLSAGSNQISGTNFSINGGTINSTPIGASTAQSGRFTTLTNTVTSSLTALTLQSTLAYSLTDTYTLSSGGIQFRNPSSNTVVSMFTVSGTNYTASSGTMPSVSISDGTMKILVCKSMGVGCQHTIFFGSGKLITPNSLDDLHVPTKLIFKRKSQSATLIWDGTSWILLNSGAYVE